MVYLIDPDKFESISLRRYNKGGCYATKAYLTQSQKGKVRYVTFENGFDSPVLRNQDYRKITDLRQEDWAYV